MDKQATAERLLKLKALSDAIKAEMDTLKSQLDVGDKIVTDQGIVQLIETKRKNYDEKAIYDTLQREGLDPSLVGEVVVKIDRKKVKNASGSLLDPHIKTTTSTRLNIDPVDSVRTKVASIEY